MQFLRSFFRRITDDLRVKKLIPLKILFFVHASTLYVLYPYLTIHMRELGINVEEAAIMSAVTPVVSIVMPPLAGMLADKIGNFKVLLAISSVLGGLSALLLLTVPVGRVTLTFPQEVELLASCSQHRLRMLHLQDHTCTPTHPYASDLNITLKTCGFICPDNSTAELSPSHNTLYSVRLAKDGETLVYRHTVRGENLGEGDRKSASRVLVNDPNYSSTVRKVSPKSLFFPTSELLAMTCTVDRPNATCTFARSPSSLVSAGTTGPLASPGSQVSLGSSGVPDTYRARVTHDATKSHVKAYGIQSLNVLGQGRQDRDFDGIDRVRCEDGFFEERVSVWSGGRELSECAPGCVALASRAVLCENKSQLIELDPQLTFLIYLAVRVFVGIISGTSFAMFEGAVIAILREQRADYGLQRIYGSIGGMISSPLSGLLIDLASRGKGYTDFRPAFYLYAALKVLSGGLMLGIDLQFKQPAKNLMKDVVTVFGNIELIALFVACFIMGTAWGYIESFLFWLLQDMGASQSLMGVTITVGGIAGLPLLVMSGPIIRRLGHANVLFIGFIFYAVRLLGYSLMYNPWLCLLFEALESVTSSLSFTAAVTYAARLSSATTDTSVQGLLGGVYYGVGKGAGSLVGGYLMKFFGTRPTYQIFAVFTFLAGCVYFLLNRFYLRKRPQQEGNDIYQKKPKPESTKDIEANLATKKQKLDDGGSDSGVENPAFSESDGAPPSLRQEKKDSGGSKDRGDSSIGDTGTENIEERDRITADKNEDCDKKVQYKEKVCDDKVVSNRRESEKSKGESEEINRNH